MSADTPKHAAPSREPYEKPAIVYEDEMEVLATACADCDLSSGLKASAASTCPLPPNDPCTTFSS